MKSFLLCCALLSGLSASAAEAPRYQLPPQLMARYKIRPLPELSRQGDPRPIYDWRLYGVSNEDSGHTRFLFELTIHHFNQLVNPKAKDIPYYHVGYFDVSPYGVIPPNETLVAYGDPQLLFPCLPETLPTAGETWYLPGSTVPRYYQNESVDERWFRFTEHLRQPGNTNLTARSSISFDRHLGLMQTNLLVVTGPRGVQSTNRVQLVEYLFYSEDDKPIMVHNAPEYIAAVVRYLRAFPEALAEDDLPRAGAILNAARVDLRESTRHIRAPHLRAMLKRYEDGHAAQAKAILQTLGERQSQAAPPKVPAAP